MIDTTSREPHERSGHEEQHAAPAPQEMNPDGPPKPSGRAKIIRNLALGGVLSLVVLAAAAFGIITLGIYRFGWRGPVSTAAIHALPYPIATVNNTPIRYADYVDDVATVKRFFAKQKEQAKGQPVGEPTEEELRKGVLDRLIQTEILKEEAVRYNITISTKDVDDEFSKVATSQQGNADQQIRDLYGWSVDQFKQKVMVPYLLQIKLAAALAGDEKLDADSKKKAEDVLAKINADGKFEDLAKQYSADPGSAAQGGDLGWFGKGVMVKEFEDAAFALKPGETSGIVKTKFGYHIIRCDDVKKEKGQIVQIKGRHILITGPNVDEYIKKKTEEAKIRRFVKI